ncbi:MAG: hypothetical protein D6782_12700, partial [Alphaproteobacteria bacterium]
MAKGPDGERPRWRKAMPDKPQPMIVAIAADAAGERLDKALARHLGHVSRARLQAAIGAGSVTIDGRVARSAAQRLA